MKVFPVKRWLGIDGVDLTIHLGITLCLAILFTSTTHSHEEIPFFGVVATSLGILALRRNRAKRRGELDQPSQISGSYALDLDQRVADLEAAQHRLFELEERVDFAERLLSQQKQADRLP
jgi:hypothetical protein